FDGHAGALPAMDHPPGDGDPLELADIAAGQDGAPELVRLGQEHLGKNDPPEVARFTASVAAVRNLGVARGEAEEVLRLARRLGARAEPPNQALTDNRAQAAAHRVWLDAHVEEPP